jgi:hypothetical protein
MSGVDWKQIANEIIAQVRAAGFMWDEDGELVAVDAFMKPTCHVCGWIDSDVSISTVEELQKIEAAMRSGARECNRCEDDAAMLEAMKAFEREGARLTMHDPELHQTMHHHWVNLVDYISDHADGPI